jgi:hypothetical protein
MPCDSIDGITEFMCGLEFLFCVFPVRVWRWINRQSELSEGSV